ncbi:hypothetical protein ACI3RH_12000, partial [Lactococcus lactis]
AVREVQESNLFASLPLLRKQKFKNRKENKMGESFLENAIESAQQRKENICPAIEKFVTETLGNPNTKENPAMVSAIAELLKFL